MIRPIEDGKPSFTLINNPKGVTLDQRYILLEGIKNGLISGKPEGIDYLSEEEAQKIIDKMRRGY